MVHSVKTRGQHWISRHWTRHGNHQWSSIMAPEHYWIWRNMLYALPHTKRKVVKKLSSLHSWVMGCYKIMGKVWTMYGFVHESCTCRLPYVVCITEGSAQSMLRQSEWCYSDGGNSFIARVLLSRCVFTSCIKRWYNSFFIIYSLVRSYCRSLRFWVCSLAVPT